MGLKEALKSQLGRDEDFVDSETGELNVQIILAKSRKFDSRLIELLLEDELTGNTFVPEVGDCRVFLRDDFQIYLENMAITSRYGFTTYREAKEPRFTIGNKSLAKRDEVALVWPYKDCVLEGGQSKVEAKRAEIFFNQILAKHEISQLLEPKVLTNAVTYDVNGKGEFTQFTRDADKNRTRGLPENTITDNLFIRGNNLMSLASIESEFRDKVKLIFIDPPYCTGKDSFGYNDTFRNSTWLTFMRNRLKQARRLLKNDGVIFITINEIQFGYLQVLMDEVFGRENRHPIITVKTATQASYRAGNPAPLNVAEYILTYSKKTKKDAGYQGNRVHVKVEKPDQYNSVVFPYGSDLEDMDEDELRELLVENDQPTDGNKQALIGRLLTHAKETLNVSEWRKITLNEFVYKREGCEDKTAFMDARGPHWNVIRKQLQSVYAKQNKDWVIDLNTLAGPSDAVKALLAMSGNERDQFHILRRNDLRPIIAYNGRSVVFYRDKFGISDLDEPTSQIENIWTDISYLSLGHEGGVSFPDGKKPEALLKRIIELATKDDDIVLDYHLGSGTTLAVAHKMGRQYIGMEQLDYGENDGKRRLQNVIGGDSSGISGEVGWDGGGSFTYLELKKLNENYEERIQSIKPDYRPLNGDELRAKIAHFDLSIRREGRRLTNPQMVTALDTHFEENRTLKIDYNDKSVNQLKDIIRPIPGLTLQGDKDQLIEKIESHFAPNVTDIWESMKKDALFDYNLSLQKFDEEFKEFLKEDLDKQKEELMLTLDKNQMYVNRSSLGDGDLPISENDVLVTTNFYQE
uniref:DNA methylase N-4/N-6 domain-containing protein n=1 Tax=uncultured marine group II/III euryarchaeote KM3_16_D12 TaxID=1457926 RepID=A0A075GJ05_9EURY|nr:DNA methylase N-4/N-6 domain-containing protein [uncultured marine group II/III euryarchaeote KM3_16_D12]